MNQRNTDIARKAAEDWNARLYILDRMNEKTQAFSWLVVEIEKAILAAINEATAPQQAKPEETSNRHVITPEHGAKLLELCKNIDPSQDSGQKEETYPWPLCPKCGHFGTDCECPKAPPTSGQDGETPRTDAKAEAVSRMVCNCGKPLDGSHDHTTCGEPVRWFMAGAEEDLIGFARVLERELSAATSALAQARSLVEEYKTQTGCPICRRTESKLAEAESANQDFAAQALEQAGKIAELRDRLAEVEKELSLVRQEKEIAHEALKNHWDDLKRAGHDDITELVSDLSSLREQNAALVKAQTGPGVGIYPASKTKHAGMWRELRKQGYPIIGTWIDEAGEGESASYEELSLRCISECRSAAVTILFCQYDETLKGALIEVGIALAAGRSVFCVGGNNETMSRVFRKHANWREFETIEEAIDAAIAHVKEGTKTL